jgi:hypothetical protein
MVQIKLAFQPKDNLKNIADFRFCNLYKRTNVKIKKIDSSL